LRIYDAELSDHQDKSTAAAIDVKNEIKSSLSQRDLLLSKKSGVF
jgi:hypothetical protein